MFAADHFTVIITLIAIGGALCFLGGISLLCVVSKSLADDKSEAVFLMGIGFFVVAICYITWKLTHRDRPNSEDEANDLFLIVNSPLN